MIFSNTLLKNKYFWIYRVNSKYTTTQIKQKLYKYTKYTDKQREYKYTEYTVTLVYITTDQRINSDREYIDTQRILIHRV